MSNEQIQKILDSNPEPAIRKACLTALGRRGGDPKAAIATLAQHAEAQKPGKPKGPKKVDIKADAPKK